MATDAVRVTQQMANRNSRHGEKQKVYGSQHRQDEMTHDEILKMPSERIRQAIAVYVFGMKLERNHGYGGGYYWIGNGVQFGEMSQHDLPEWDTDISAAWEVVKEMNAKNYWFGCQVLSSKCQAWFSNEPGFNIDATAKTFELPLAICRAALLAVMEDK